MKNFNWKKYLIAVVAVYIIFEVLEYLIHGVILMGKYESLGDSGLFREDMDSYMWITYVTAIVFSIFFVYLYHYFCNAYKTGWKAGLYYGLIVAFMMGIMGIYNQYAVYPVPGDLAMQWVVFRILEIAIVGIVVGFFYKPKAVE